MNIRSAKRRLGALAVVACMAAILSLPGAASARPLIDPEPALPTAPSSTVTSGGGNSLELLLAGAALAWVLTGAGYGMFRIARLAHVKT